MSAQPILDYTALSTLASSGKSGIVLSTTSRTIWIDRGNPSSKIGSESTIITLSVDEGVSWFTNVAQDNGECECSKSNLLLRVGQTLGKEQSALKVSSLNLGLGGGWKNGLACGIRSTWVSSSTSTWHGVLNGTCQSSNENLRLGEVSLSKSESPVASSECRLLDTGENGQTEDEGEVGSCCKLH